MIVDHAGRDHIGRTRGLTADGAGASKLNSEKAGSHWPYPPGSPCPSLDRRQRKAHCNRSSAP